MQALSLSSKLKADISQWKLGEKVDQNKFFILLLFVILIYGIAYGLINNFIGNQWLFGVILILIFAVATVLRFVVSISTIYVIMFILISVSALLFFINKLAGIIMSVLVGLLLLHLLYLIVVKNENITNLVANFFSDMSISSVSGAWNSITKITTFLCSYFVKGFLAQLVSKSMLIIFLMYLALVVYIYTKQPYQIVSDNKSIFLCIFLFIGFSLLSLLVMGFEAFVPFITSVLKYTILIGIVIVKFIGAEAPGYISGPPTWSSLVFKMLIYIPCLFLDAIGAVKTELKLAQQHWTYVIILIVEIILIALLFILPIAFDAVINHSGEVILDSVLPLNVKSDTLQVTTTDSNNVQTTSLTPSLADNVNNKLPIYNYGISAWFYIHPAPQNTNKNYTVSGGVPILDFSGSPTIKYDASNNLLNIIVGGATIPQTSQPQSQIPLQRWNHLFINFNNNGIMDVFLNNHLETSVPNVIPVLPTSLTVGSSSGIYGQACNVVYYRNVLGSDGISWIYNSHKNLNPPLNPNF